VNQVSAITTILLRLRAQAVIEEGVEYEWMERQKRRKKKGHHKVKYQREEATTGVLI